MSPTRLGALIVKEAKILLRDPFSFVLGVGFPIALLTICGLGMSTDVRNIRVALVVPESSELASSVVARFVGSPYFDVEVVRTTAAGEALVKSRRADLCVFLPQDLERRLKTGDLRILVANNASNPSLAYTKESLVEATLTIELTRAAASGGESGARIGETRGGATGGSSVRLSPRLWFNDANASSFALIPGLIVIVVIVVGALTTATNAAREYERGTLESLFVTPATSAEILLAKAINYFALGAIGFAAALLAARFAFNVPIRSSWFVVPLGSSVFLTMALHMGLLIGSVAKNQFIAVEIAAFATFLPSLLLSGFVFEIKSMPTILQWITVFVPARYYVDFLQTAFLVGDVRANIVKNVGALALFAVWFLFLAKVRNPKRLEG